MSLPTTMRAVQYDKFGGSDLLTINEVPVPSPRPGQVLVRVQAFSVNRIDVIVREGEMRLFTGKRFPKGTGVDALGEIVSVGILDCGGVVTAFYRNYLKPGGRMMTVSPDGLPAVLTSLFTNRRVGFLLATKASSEAMKWITNAVERGQLRPVIEKKYSLEELGAAQDRVAEKHTRGKLVVVM